jgi:hypothetical protein
MLKQIISLFRLDFTEIDDQLHKIRNLRDSYEQLNMVKVEVQKRVPTK